MRNDRTPISDPGSGSRTFQRQQDLPQANQGPCARLGDRQRQQEGCTHDLEELVLTHRVVPSEPIDGLEDVSAHQLLAALQPAAEAQARANVRRVLWCRSHLEASRRRQGSGCAYGDLHGLLVAGEGAEESTGHAAQRVCAHDRSSCAHHIKAGRWGWQGWGGNGGAQNGGSSGWIPM